MDVSEEQFRLLSAHERRVLVAASVAAAVEHDKKIRTAFQESIRYCVDTCCVFIRKMVYDNIC